MTDLWPHQQRAIDLVREAIRKGAKFPCVVSPTGSGKSLVQAELAKLAFDKGKRVIVFTNRKILVDQMSRTFSARDIEHGIMQSGKHYTPLTKMMPVKIASIQTFNSWVLESDKHEAPEADMIIVDEIHSNTATVARKIFEHYPLAIGFTATPVGLKGLCDVLVEAANYSELMNQAPPKIVPCDVYAPTEVDMDGLKLTNGEYSQKAMIQRVKESNVFGDIMEHWNRLNPWKKPTLVFAPGVKESIHIVDEIFKKQNVDAAHVDGETPEHERKAIFDAFRKGNLTVISSCGVLREGFDAPNATHGILLQVAGKLSTYLQIVGRLLRAHPDKSRATLQDHTAAIWRHGAPDIDRHWDLDDDDVKLAKERKQQLEKGKKSEGICCPECSFVRTAGPKCPNCGFQHEKSVRRIRTKEGQLKLVKGPVIKPKKVKNHEDFWRSMIYRGLNCNMTVGQMQALFYRERGAWPSESIIPREMLPSNEADKARRVSEVYGRDARTHSSKGR